MLALYSTAFGSYMRRATPSLDPDLRAKIDEAVAAGRVKVIPRGVSAFPIPKWNGKTLTSDVTADLDPTPFYRARKMMLERSAAQAAARRREIREDVLAGMNYRQIAAKRGEGLESTRKIVQALRREIAAHEPAFAAE